MPDVLDLVEPILLDHVPPRRLPLFFVPNLIGEYLIEQPVRVYFDPMVIVGLLVAIAVATQPVAPFAWIAFLIILFVRAGGACWQMYRSIREDYLLMRYGMTVFAHVMGVRTCRDAAGALSGAFIDCVIPISRRRTSVGSVWMPDAGEALRIGQTGNLRVICLARSPGIWRLREGDGPHLRYEPASE